MRKKNINLEDTKNIIVKTAKDYLLYKSLGIKPYKEVYRTKDDVWCKYRRKESWDTPATGESFVRPCPK